MTDFHPSLNPSLSAETSVMEQTKHPADNGTAAGGVRFSFSSAAWFVLGMMALMFLEFRAVALIDGMHITLNISRDQGILSGHPEWRLYQSRLLGPLLVEGVAHLTHRPFSLAYNIVTRSLLLLANGLCYRLFFLLGRSRRLAWGYTVAYAGLFVALQDARALCIWDYVDLVTLLCFAFLVFTRTNLPLLALLFFVELLNREAATFIGLWIMLEAVRVPAAGSAKRLEIIPVRLLVGVALIAVGAFWTHWIRDRLFISQVLPAAAFYVLGDQLWQVASNLHMLHYPLRGGIYGSGVALIVVGALVALFAQPSVLPADKKFKVSILLGAMLLSIFCFAQINETRVWFELAPFLLFLFYYSNPPSGA